MANTVIIHLSGHIEPWPIYHGQATVRPTHDGKAIAIIIIVPDGNKDALRAMRQQLDRWTGQGVCSITVEHDENHMIIRAPLHGQMVVREAVGIGARLLLLDMIARNYQPVSLNARYELPGIRKDNVKTDNGEVLREVQGLRFGGVDLFLPVDEESRRRE